MQTFTLEYDRQHGKGQHGSLWEPREAHLSQTWEESGYEGGLPEGVMPMFSLKRLVNTSQVEKEGKDIPNRSTEARFSAMSF